MANSLWCRVNSAPRTRRYLSRLSVEEKIQSLSLSRRLGRKLPWRGWRLLSLRWAATVVLPTKKYLLWRNSATPPNVTKPGTSISISSSQTIPSLTLTIGQLFPRNVRMQRIPWATPVPTRWCMRVAVEGRAVVSTSLPLRLRYPPLDNPVPSPRLSHRRVSPANLEPTRLSRTEVLMASLHLVQVSCPARLLLIFRLGL
jgi:hypothetical protein